MASARFTVREMRPDEMHLRIEYFHAASDAQLRTLGVDRARLPSPEVWQETYVADQSRPLQERSGYSLVWELDDAVVGFSSADRITFGQEAHMHLHILDADRRRRGLGTRFVRLSATEYFDVLELERLYCEPNALNVAPNRTLQRAGFRYDLSHQCTPGPLNFPQVTTRWVLDRDNAAGGPFDHGTDREGRG
jgi:RimJ/RimL family protein N-acetyltransferase